MARIEITLPAEFIFSTDIPVRIGDINRGLHLGHESYLVIIEEARMRFLQSLGYTEFDICGTGILITDLAIVYLKQVRYGQTIRTDIAASDVTDKGFDLVYKMSDAQTGVEVARVKTGHVLLDYQKGKVTRVPEEVKRKLFKE